MLADYERLATPEERSWRHMKAEHPDEIVVVDKGNGLLVVCQEDVKATNKAIGQKLDAPVTENLIVTTNEEQGMPFTTMRVTLADLQRLSDKGVKYVVLDKIGNQAKEAREKKAQHPSSVASKEKMEERQHKADVVEKPSHGEEVLRDAVIDRLRESGIEVLGAAEGHKSTDLKTAIEQKKGRIIITTVQMFPEIADTIKFFPDRKYAVIIDEAHSSQSGENNRQMRKALSLEEATQQDAEDEEANDEEKKLNDIIETEMKRKGHKDNVSFFAFTATPKPKTIEVFCERENGSKEPFDIYTMEQAIKEEFILDVMKDYMSFKRYYRLVRDEKFDDKEYDKKKSVRLLASYVDLQDAAIERKSRIMLEHFASQTVNEIEGKARAMLVTRSRLHAVRYKLKFDSIMQEMNLPYRALVAFSGTVYDEETNMEYTETSMNNLEGKVSIPEALKMPKYRILIVANKYQTGFDEPLLHTMFVDKKLGGTSTVQTLSRLNRCKRGKTGTMVLDFVNDPDDVQKVFQEYYGKNLMKEEDETDPNSLYDVKGNLRDFGVFTSTDVDAFAKYFFATKKEDQENKQKINAVLDEVCDRAIKNLPQDMLDTFRKTCKTFHKLYSFLSQIITFQDAELEKLSPFCLALAKKLPFKKEGLPYDVLNETQLESYRVQYISTRNLSLESGDTQMKGMRPGESQTTPDDEYDWLSNIIKVLNETFGIELTDEDKVELNNLKNKVMGNEELLAFFNPQNSRDDVKSKFDEQVDSELLNFINTKFELYNKLTEDRANTLFKNTWFNEVYDNRVRGMR